MRSVNIFITIFLTAIAVILWMPYVYRTYIQGWPTAIRFLIPAIAFSSFACVGWVIMTTTRQNGEGETRCRKCRYILRGISEPRCPECDEQI